MYVDTGSSSFSQGFFAPKAQRFRKLSGSAICNCRKRRNQEYSASVLEYGRRFADEGESTSGKEEKHRSPTFDRLIAELDGAS